MSNRRWITAWRLLSSGQIKELTIRTCHFLTSFRNKSQEIAYPEWRSKWVELNIDERTELVEIVNALSEKPSFSIFVSANQADNSLLFSTVESVVSQIYPNWFLHIMNSDSADSDFLEKISALEDDRLKFSDSIQSASSEWVVELDPGIKLHEAALAISVLSIIKNPATMIVYSDHDHTKVSGEFCDPHMKPDWNADLLAAVNYFAPFMIFDKDLWEEKQTKEKDKHDLLIEITKELPRETILHIPSILSSVTIFDEKSHLYPPVKRIKQPLPSPEPFVSILIPSKDQGRALKKCIESIYKETNYKNFEIILIDHETSEPKAVKCIDEFNKKEGFRVIKYSGSFNYSAMMNRAAEVSNGQVLILLNNDTEIIESGWLTELVSQVSRPEVGVAGALLLFEDRTIQHAGIHPGLGGLMGHGHKHLAADDPGYFNRLKTVHEVTAVTGACLAIEKSTWSHLGGLDETNLQVAYNDIDLCLKARSSDLRVVFTPFAKLLHHESVSRGLDKKIEKNPRLQKELQVMKDKWGDFLKVDPAYSPNLSLDGGGFKINKNPNTNKKILF